jgi:hypothetical protein
VVTDGQSLGFATSLFLLCLFPLGGVKIQVQISIQVSIRVQFEVP